MAMLVGAVGCSKTPQEKYVRFLAAGQKQLEQSDYNRAVLNFRNAIQARPKEAEGYYQLALAYLGSGQFKEGVTALRQATEASPEYAPAQLKLAELMIRTHDAEMVKDAEGRVQKVLVNRPADNDALFELAAAQLELGKPEEAEQHLDRILEKSPKHLRSAMALAKMKLSRRDLAGAEEVMKKLAESSPTSPDAAVALGSIYVAAENLTAAEAQFRKALQVSPRNASALLALGAIELKVGQTTEAEQIYKQIAQLPQKQYELSYATFLMQQNRRDEAVRELERLVKRDGQDRFARSGLVIAYTVIGRQKDADQILSDALKKNPNDADALLQRIQSSLQKASYAEAQRDLERVLGNDPGSAQAHYLKAKLHDARGDLLQEKMELAKTLELLPDSLRVRLDLANVLMRSNNSKAALQTLNEATAKQKRIAGYLITRTWVLLSMREQGEARTIVNAVLQAGRFPDVLLQDAVLKLAGRDFAAARLSLEEILKAQPDDLRALSVLAQTYAAQKQSPAAAEKIRFYVEQKPNSARLQMFWANWLLTNGKKSEARVALETAKMADQKLAAADILLARLDFDEGKLESARRRLAPIMAAAPKNTEVQMMLGEIAAVSNNHQEAVDHYLRAVEADDRNVAALNNLAYEMSRDSAHMDEALKYAQKAKELAPGSSYTQDTLGWIYYRKGLYQLAARELEIALANEGRPAVEFHLGLTYRRLGNEGKAARLLASALAAQPGLAKTEPIP